jgi:hypothetical protein
MYDLKENHCHEDARLEVKHLPKSLKLKDRERLVEQMETEEPRLENFIRLAVKLFRRNFKSIVSTKNIEFTLGSSIYVETVWHECPESSRGSVHHRGNFVQDIHPGDK